MPRDWYNQPRSVAALISASDRASASTRARARTRCARTQNDVEYPFQEGVFFGNVFDGDAYVCGGHDAEKGAQSKRFCALAPAPCTGIATFHDAGPCEDAWQFACRPLRGGTKRCSAVACNDPTGRTWKSPVTVFLHDRIETGNADTITGAESRGDALEALRDVGHALYRHVDFGAAGSVHRFVATVTAPAAATSSRSGWPAGKCRSPCSPSRPRAALRAC